MRLNEVTISEYIALCLAPEKPDGWDELTKELDKILPSNGYNAIIDLYRRQLILTAKKILSAIDEKQDARIDIELNRVLRQIELLSEKKDSGKDMSEKDFIAWVMLVSKHIGYRIDRDKTSMLDFAIATKQMQDEQKIALQQMKQMNNVRRK
jgi:hypothetical protein